MKLIISALLTFFYFSISAQTEIFTLETFDGAIPSTWTIIDVDGNTASSSGFAPYAAWGYYQDPDYYFQCAASAASYTPAGTSDDWLISPTISIPASGDMLLAYKCKSRWSGAENDYEVRMSIGAGSTDPSDFTYLIYSESSVPTSWQWENFMLPAAALGNDIHIAFREITSGGNIFCLDDVAVYSLHPDDIGISSLTNEVFVEAGVQEIKGVVQNRGVNPISSYTLSWDDGSGLNSETVVDAIPSWGYSAFTHTVDLNAVAGNYYDLEVTATVTGDGDASNSTAMGWMSCVSSTPIKYVVGEERTGTWCGWCPRGAVGQATMESVPTWIGIAIHGENSGSDPMEHTIYNDKLDYYIPFGFPTSGVDRTYTYVDPNDYLAYHNLRVNEITPAVITLDAVADGSDLSVTVNAEMYGKIAAGDFRLACVVTEDHVTGTTSGFDQNNYYSFEASDLPLVGAGHDWQAEPSPVPASDMEYNHVARLLGDDEINGTSGSLPAVADVGETYSFTYNFDASVIDDLDNCHFIGMLINNATGEIVQAGISSTYSNAPLGVEENSSPQINIYPNPASNTTFIDLNLPNDADVAVTIYNVIGEIVYIKPSALLYKGVNHLPIDVADFPVGIYMISVLIDDEIQSIKFLKG